MDMVQEDLLIADRLEFQHPILRLMPFAASVPKDLLALQEIVSGVFDERAGIGDRLEYVNRLKRHLITWDYSAHDRKTVVQDVLRVLAERTRSLQVIERLVEVHLEAAGLTVQVEQDVVPTKLMPTVEKDEREASPREIRVPEPVATWTSLAVSDLVARSSDDITSLGRADVFAALRLLQMRVFLFNDRAGQAYGALRFMEGQGLSLWNDLLRNLEQRNLLDEEALHNFGERRQRALRRHLQGLSAIHGWSTPNVKTREPEPSNSSTQSGSGWHIVIPGDIPPSRGDDQEALERFEALQAPIRVAALPTCEEIDRLEEVLHVEFPWAQQAVSLLAGDLRVRRLCGGVELGSAPTLLVGAPGSGKSRLVRRIAESLKIPFCPLALAGMSDSMALVGTARGWSTGQASPLIDSMLRNKCASGLVLLDEIDKVGGASRHSVPPTVALLNLLEPENAKRWYDTFLQTPCDVSKLMFWATANWLSPLSEPLLSRFRVILVPSPAPDHFGVIAQGAVSDIEKEWGLPQDTLREIAPQIPVSQVTNARQVREAAKVFIHRWAVERLGKRRLH